MERTKEHSIAKTTELFNQASQEYLSRSPKDPFASQIRIDDFNLNCRLYCLLNKYENSLSFSTFTKIKDKNNTSIRHPYFNAHIFKKLSILFFENLYNIEKIDNTYGINSDNLIDFNISYEVNKSPLIAIRNTWDYKDNIRHGFYPKKSSDIYIDNKKEPSFIYATYWKIKTK
jgi:hypothetical protein